MPDNFSAPPLPAQVDYLVRAVQNKTDDIWTRKSFRDRLEAMATRITSVVEAFDAEFRTASNTRKTTKKGKP